MYWMVIYYLWTDERIHFMVSDGWILVIYPDGRIFPAMTLPELIPHTPLT